MRESTKEIIKQYQRDIDKVQGHGKKYREMTTESRLQSLDAYLNKWLTLEGSGLTETGKKWCAQMTGVILHEMEIVRAKQAI